MGFAVDHPLRQEGVERLRCVHNAQVARDVAEETGVEEVQDSVLDASHVEVHGHACARVHVQRAKGAG